MDYGSIQNKRALKIMPYSGLRLGRECVVGRAEYGTVANTLQGEEYVSDDGVIVTANGIFANKMHSISVKTVTILIF